MISRLSADREVSGPQFRRILKFLLGFISKDRQIENLVEKLARRFENIYFDDEDDLGNPRNGGAEDEVELEDVEAILQQQQQRQLEQQRKEQGEQDKQPSEQDRPQEASENALASAAAADKNDTVRVGLAATVAGWSLLEETPTIGGKNFPLIAFVS